MRNTLAAKVIEGFDTQGWNIIGRGGSWAGAMRPLEAYIQRKIERAVKAEREACARVCEQSDEDGEGPDCWGWHSKDYTAAIRARSKE